MQPSQAAANALRNVLDAAANERILIICDKDKLDIARAFAQGAMDIGMWTRQIVLQPEPLTKKESIRTDVPKHLHEVVTSSKADIFINLLRGSAEETPFRINLIQLENRNRMRLGHCPGITVDMMTKGALALTDTQYKKMQQKAQDMLHQLQNVVSVHVTNEKGTDLKLSTLLRAFFTDTKLNWRTMKWMNLPVGEVIVGPVEDSLEGRLVCDMAIGGIGRIKKPLTIDAKKGRAVKVDSKDKKVLKRVKEALKTDKWSSNIGEFAMGLNPKARLSKEFLEIEKIGNTAHIAFGNNLDFPGGRNPSANHMDFLISAPTVELTKSNGDTYTIMKKGKVRV
jgi:leucyl aminopeptidase (aminopeptidase T)